MAVAYHTPGVYYEQIDANLPGINLLRMDIAGFAGIASRGPLDTPVPVESWRQFKAYFGDFTSAGYLAFTVRAFFENGGERCWVVRVADRETASESDITLRSASGALDIWRIRAFSPGMWGNNLSIQIKELNRAQTVSSPPNLDDRFLNVATTSGFERAGLVRLSQENGYSAIKVISHVDSVEGRLYWLHPDPEKRLPYDSMLSGFNRDRPIFIESVSYTLLVRESGQLIEQYSNLSLVPEHASYGPRVLKQVVTQLALQNTGRIPAVPRTVVIEEKRNVSLANQIVEIIDTTSSRFELLQGGTDGLSKLSVTDFMGEQVSPLDSDLIKARKRRGIRTFELVDEIAVVAVPDIHIKPAVQHDLLRPEIKEPDPCAVEEAPAIAGNPEGNLPAETPPEFTNDEIYRVQSLLVQHCEEQQNRIALLDVPFLASQEDEHGIATVLGWRQRFDSKYAALYYPWIKVVNPFRTRSTQLTRSIPPSGFVAGIIATGDFEVGIYKAPANVGLNWVQDVTKSIGETAHGVLNPQGINVIRSFPGRGIRIFGARTVSSDPDWRYLNVRRLIIFISKAIYQSIQWAVFEPNNFLTRNKLQLSIGSFLTHLWTQGALAGDSVEKAFFVRCDETNNPPHEREKGRLFIDIGVAPSEPFEFVVIRVGRAENEIEIRESLYGGRSY